MRDLSELDDQELILSKEGTGDSATRVVAKVMGSRTVIIRQEYCVDQEEDVWHTYGDWGCSLTKKEFEKLVDWVR